MIGEPDAVGWPTFKLIDGLKAVAVELGGERDGVGWPPFKLIDEFKAVAVELGRVPEVVLAHTVASDGAETSRYAHKTSSAFSRFCNSGIVCDPVTEAAGY